MTTTLSIVMPVKQYKKETHFALLSILASAEQDIEVILAENQSDSEIPIDTSLLEERKVLLQDTRVKHYPSKHYLSMSENWARALSLATSKYVAFVGADDGIVTEHLASAVRYLQEADRDIVLTSYTTFSYEMSNQKSFVHFQKRATNRKVFQIKFAPFINALFLGTREAMMPIVFNRCIVKRSLLMQAIATSCSVPGIAPDNYLTHFIMQRQSYGAYLNFPIFISGSSESSTGRMLILDPSHAIFQEWSVDQQSRSGILTKEFSLACLSAMMIEDYLLVINRSQILENQFILACARVWILFSCFDENHHKGHFFIATLPLRKLAVDLIVRLIIKVWSLRFFGFTNYFKSVTIRLPADSTVLDAGRVVSTQNLLR